jgi:hypothetical protein
VLVKPAAIFTLALLLAGCSSGIPGFPPETVGMPAWPTLAACVGTLPGPDNAACMRVDVENTLSPMFALWALDIEVDGRLLFAMQDRGKLADTRAFTVFLGQAPAGEHTLRLAAWLVPGPAIPTSLQSYRWQMCVEHRFTVAPGGGFDLRAILNEKHDDPPEESLRVRFLENGSKPPGDGSSRKILYPDACPRSAPRVPAPTG